MGATISYAFRILTENNSGRQESYNNSAFLQLDYNADVGISKSLAEITNSINLMTSCSWIDAPGANISQWKDQASSTGSSWNNYDDLYFSQSSYIRVGSKTLPVQNDGTSGARSVQALMFSQPTESRHFVFNIASQGMISQAPSEVTDPLYRYKFFGTKVCEALGIPENQWIYTDVFRVSNRADRPHNFGSNEDTEIMADKLYVRQALTLSSQATMNSHIPFHLKEDTDRLIYFKSGSSNRIALGYTRTGNDSTGIIHSYGLQIGNGFTTHSHGVNLEISESAKIGGNLQLGNIENVSQSIADASQTGTGGGFTSFGVKSDAVTVREIVDGETVNFLGGQGISTTTPSDNTIQIQLSNQPTNLTTVYNSGLHIGADDETEINFATSNQIKFRIDDADKLVLYASALSPLADDDISLGISSKQWQDLYLASGSIIYFGASSGDTTMILQDTDKPEQINFARVSGQANIKATGNISASGDLLCGDDLFVGDDIYAPNIGTGADDSVLIKDGDGYIKTDEIDSRVWGSSLVDKTGTPANNQLAIFTDSNTLEGDSDVTFDGTLLKLNGSLSASSNSYFKKAIHVNSGLDSSPLTNMLFINNLIGSENGIMFISQSAPFLSTNANSIKLGLNTTSGNNAWAIYDHALSKSILKWDRTTSAIQIGPGSSTETTTVQNQFRCLQDIHATGSISASLIHSSGDVIAYYTSDERLKDDIEVISNPLEKINKLKGVSYRWNGNQDIYPKGNKDSGIIAQDVEAVLPELVKTNPNGYLGVKHDRLVGLLIEGIKEQQLQINELKVQLKKLKGDK